MRLCETLPNQVRRLKYHLYAVLWVEVRRCGESISPTLICHSIADSEFILKHPQCFCTTNNDANNWEETSCKNLLQIDTRCRNPRLTRYLVACQKLPLWSGLEEPSASIYTMSCSFKNHLTITHEDTIKTHKILHKLHHIKASRSTSRKQNAVLQTRFIGFRHPPCCDESSTESSPPRAFARYERVCNWFLFESLLAWYTNMSRWMGKYLIAKVILGN
jgi:hypothetical protein